MNSISAGARLYAQQAPMRFKRLGSIKDSPHKVPDIVRIDATELLNTIAMTLAVGCGILMSPTSDGGAVSVILYDGEERYRSYVSSQEELVDLLHALNEHMEGKMAGPPTKAPKSRQ